MANGYKSFKIDISGQNTNFTAQSTVSITGQSGKTSNVSYTSTAAMNFNLVEGLAAGTYEAVVDMDGVGATADQVKANFVVASAPTITSLSPNPIMNNGSTAVKMTVLGSGTHFTAASSSPQIDILNNTGETIQNVKAINDTTLTFDLIPNTVTSTGTYGVKVTTDGSAISESVTNPAALQVSNQGINTSPSQVSKLDLRNKVITLTANNFSFNDGAVSLAVEGQSATVLSNTGDTVTFKVPSGLSSGTNTIVATVGISTYNSTISVLDSSITDFSPAFKVVGYSAFTLTLTGNDTVTFSNANLPTIKVNGTSVGTVTVSDANNTASFTFPAGIASGNPTISLAWSGGSYAGNTLTLNNFLIKHEINQLTLWNGAEPADNSMSVYLNSAPISLIAIANVINGSGGSDKSSICTWNSSNTSVATVSGGTVTIKGIGTTDITISYDGQTDLLSLTVVGPYSINVTGASNTLLFGGSMQLSASALYGDSTSAAVTAGWSTSDNLIATVSSGGLVKAIAEGTATINAAYGGKTGSYAVTVSGAVLLPSSVNTIELGSKDIIVSGVDTSGGAGSITITAGGQTPSKSLTGGVLKFTVPSSLTSGTKPVSITVAGQTYTTSLAVKQSSFTPNYSSLDFGYSAFNMELAGSNVTFDNSTSKPIVKVGSTIIADASVTVDQLQNKIVFPFPTELTANTYIIELSWTGGPYNGEKLTSSVTVSGQGTQTPLPTDSTTPKGGNQPQGVTLPPSGSPQPTATPTPAATPVISSSTPIPETYKPVLDNINKGTDAIKNEADPDKAKQQALDLINTNADTLKNMADSGASTKDVSKALKDAATAALEKVSSETVKAQVTGNTASVVIDASSVSKLMSKLDTIIETAGELNSGLSSAGSGEKVESVLNIVVTSSASADEQSVQLPAALIEAAAQKNLDKISIQTGVATIQIAPDAISTTGSQTVSLSAKKVDAQQLTDQVRSAVGGSQVYDFSALAGDKKITTFSKPVEITIPYALKIGEDPEKVTVFYVSDNGKLENVTGIYDKASGTVKFATSHFSGYFVKLNDLTFNDIGSFGWAKTNIEVMASKGIITGVGDGRFNPGANITRAEFAAMLVREFKLQDSAASSSFSDVSAKDWFYSSVSSAVKAGLITGRPDGKFAPMENITRQDMAVMLARALTKLKGKAQNTGTASYVEKFNDKGNISEYARQSADMAVKYSLITGQPGGLFAPGELATRAQAAAVIYRMFYIE